MALRRPAVAGAFYAASSDKLKKQIIECFTHPLGPGILPELKQKTNIVSIVSPHAGYVYSGPAAAHSYLALGEQSTPDTIVIIGPNHTGWGKPVSVMNNGLWETPLGKVPIDTDLANMIIDLCDLARSDETAFIREHSIEVQIPFLQYIYSEFNFVPICMGYQDLKTSTELGKALYEASKGKDIIVIASSDLTHQESRLSANKKDKYVLDAIRVMDEKTLQESVKRYNITTCGYGPISATLVYSKLKKATKAEVLSYYTSGDIIGDYRAVVGYAAAKIVREK
jgi:AmmeMemoRadiSam system protein B